MKTRIAHHLHTLRGALARLARAPLSALLNIAVVGVALSLPLGLYVALDNVRILARQAGGGPQISVFLALEAGAGDAAEIEARLKRHRGVRAFHFVARDEALRELKQGAGLADALENLEKNPLPDAFVIQPADGAPQRLEALRDEMRQWPKIAHVQLDSAWVKKLDALLKLGRLAAELLAALLSFALAAVAFNTIRLQILGRREEIEVAKLIGATDSFIRLPFLYYGALQGLLGGLAAWSIIAAAVSVLDRNVSDLAGLYGAEFHLRTLSAADGVAVLLFSSGLGWLGAWLSATWYLQRPKNRSS